MAAGDGYTFAEFNNKLAGQYVKIEMKDGKELYANDVRISGDSLLWIDRQAVTESYADMHEVAKIVDTNHLLGALECTGIGLVGGAGVGALVGELTIGDESILGSGGGAIVGAILGGGAGTIIGFFTGLVVGHTYNYEFPLSFQNELPQNRK
jgi:hypothetical protein